MPFPRTPTIFVTVLTGFVIGCSSAAPPPPTDAQKTSASNKTPPVDTTATDASNKPAPTEAASAKAAVEPPPVKVDNCAQNACQDHFTIKMKAKPFDPKQWAIELSMDGKKASCTFEWADTSTTADCKGGISMAFQNPPIEDGVRILVTVPGTPSSIDFTVLHNGTPVEPMRTYKPKYEPMQSKDPACPSTCKHASGPFVLK